jgi:hypothetical protein
MVKIQFQPTIYQKKLDRFTNAHLIISFLKREGDRQGSKFQSSKCLVIKIHMT